MSSSDSATLTELEKDLPTTREDIEALRRLRASRPSDPFAALQAIVDSLPAAARRQRRTTAAGRPELQL